MSGAGRFSFLDDDENEEVPQTPVPGSFPFSFGTPTLAPVVHAPILEVPEPAPPLNSISLLKNTPLAPSDSSNIPVGGLPPGNVPLDGASTIAWDARAPQPTRVISFPLEKNSMIESYSSSLENLLHGTSEPSKERAKFTADAFSRNFDATNQAITEFRNLLKVGSDLTAAKRATITEMLGDALFQRFENYRDVDDMEEAVEIQMQFAALALEEGADPALRAKSHGRLGRTLTAQFEHTGDPDDAELAIDHLNQALRMMPLGHPGRPAVLADFARAELAQYAHSDDLNRLQQALARCEEALALVPMEAPERTPLSGLLGGALLSRFERTNSPEDIARAVEYLEFAVAHTPEGNPERPKRMRSYGDAILARSAIEDDLNGLDVAIGIQEAALELLTPEHTAYPAVIGSLAKALHARFKRTNNGKDLDRAIECLKIAAECSPFSDAQYPYTIEFLGNLYVTKSHASIQPASGHFVDDAIALLGQSIALTTPEHPRYNCRCEFLENASRIKALLLASQPSEERAKFAADAFLATGNLEAASQAITELKDLLNAGSDLPAAKRVEAAEILSSVFSKRFEYFGDVGDMEEAVEIQMQFAALALEKGADPALRAKSHGRLGRTLTAQFEHTGDPDDAELAIDHLNQALRMMPLGHPGRPAVLADFARAELAQYAHSDDLNRLQQALARCEEALTSVPMEAPERTPLSGLIGGALLSRFERTHSPEDIARAVEYLEFAVNHTPEGNPERPKRMRSYGDAILARSAIEDDLNGLDVAIGIQEAALELLTPEHAAYPAVTGSLAKAFHTRFRSTNNVEDLDMAIDRFKTTVEFTSFTDPNHARITDLLGKSFMAKYRAATQPPRTEFLDYAITLHRQAVALTSSDHRHYAGRLESLGKAYSKRYRSMLRRQSAAESDLQEAERCLREAMSRDPSRADNLFHELGKLNLQ